VCQIDATELEFEFEIAREIALEQCARGTENPSQARVSERAWLMHEVSIYLVIYRYGIIARDVVYLSRYRD